MPKVIDTLFIKKILTNTASQDGAVLIVQANIPNTPYGALSMEPSTADALVRALTEAKKKREKLAN